MAESVAVWSAHPGTVPKRKSIKTKPLSQRKLLKNKKKTGGEAGAPQPVEPEQVSPPPPQDLSESEKIVATVKENVTWYKKEYKVSVKTPLTEFQTETANVLKAMLAKTRQSRDHLEHYERKVLSLKTQLSKLRDSPKATAAAIEKSMLKVARNQSKLDVAVTNHRECMAGLEKCSQKLDHVAAQIWPLMMSLLTLEGSFTKNNIVAVQNRLSGDISSVVTQSEGGDVLPSLKDIMSATIAKVEPITVGSIAPPPSEKPGNAGGMVLSDPATVPPPPTESDEASTPRTDHRKTKSEPVDKATAASLAVPFIGSGKTKEKKVKVVKSSFTKDTDPAMDSIESMPVAPHGFPEASKVETASGAVDESFEKPVELMRLNDDTASSAADTKRCLDIPQKSDSLDAEEVYIAEDGDKNKSIDSANVDPVPEDELDEDTNMFAKNSVQLEKSFIDVEPMVEEAKSEIVRDDGHSEKAKIIDQGDKLSDMATEHEYHMVDI